MGERPETQDPSQEMELAVPQSDAFLPPTIDTDKLLSGNTYTYFSPIPSAIESDLTTECVIGIDEAGRGPVLGPMVYSLFYCPKDVHYSLLRDTHAFTDSKALTAEVRIDLMRSLCAQAENTAEPEEKATGTTAETAAEEMDTEERHTTTLPTHCGYAATLLSAASISSHMLPSPRTAPYNLNAQAMDATVALIQKTFDMGINITDIYVDTIGKPEVYQRKLERIFPAARIYVEKKADATYPVVGAASVVAKTTRDLALEVLWDTYMKQSTKATTDAGELPENWGSGYPGDARTIGWLKSEMDPIFGWGTECRFSWGTAKELLEGKSAGIKVDYEDFDSKTVKMTDFFNFGEDGDAAEDELGNWYGKSLSEETL